MNLFFIIMLILILIISSMVIISRNPVNAVLFLVIVFIMNAVLFIMLGIEFFAILLFTVYVGAIAILFLFVLMIFNLRLIDLYGNVYYHMPSGYLMSILQILLFVFIIIHDYNIFIWDNINWKLLYISNSTNLKIIGVALYNFCIDYFILVGLLLFIAMIGVIAITITNNYSKKVQDVNRISRENIWWVNIQLIYNYKVK